MTLSLYTFALLTHILGCLVLFMAIAVEWVCLRRMRRAETAEQLREWASLTKTIAKPLPLSTLALVGSGLYMTVQRSWVLGVDWLSLSMASALVMSVVGGTYNSRRLEAIAGAAEKAPSGRIASALLRQIQDPVLLSSVQALAALAFGVVFLKVVRPDPIGAVAALVIAVAIGVLSARLSSRVARPLAEAGGSPPVTTAR